MRVTAMVIITETVGETGAENSLEHSLTVQPLGTQECPSLRIPAATLGEEQHSSRERTHGKPTSPQPPPL